MFKVTFKINNTTTTLYGRSINKLVERAKREIREFGLFGAEKLGMFSIHGFNGQKTLFTVDSVWFCNMYFNESDEMRSFVDDMHYWFMQKP